MSGVAGYGQSGYHALCRQELTDVMNETMNDPEMVGILHHDEGVDAYSSKP